MTTNQRSDDQIEAPPSRPTYPLQVAYDAHAFVSPEGGTGKGAQLRNLLGRYAQCFTGFAPSGPANSGPNIIRIGLTRYSLWQQLSLPLLLRQWKPDIFLAPYNTAPLIIPSATRLVLVLHDLILMTRCPAPNLSQRILTRLKRRLVPPSVARASIVLTVSEYSRQQIAQRFPKAMVETISCTIPGSWFVREDAAGPRERDGGILLVTSTAAHKNTAGAMKAFKLYSSQAGKAASILRIVGLPRGETSFRNLARDLGIAGLVAFEPYLPEQDLQALYRRAKALLIPSLMEGFGIPALEAMASGTPVIASNTTSLPEVCGRAAIYFDPMDIDQMAAAVTSVMAKEDLRREMSADGLRQAEIFHPNVIGQQVEKFWAGVASTTKPTGNR